MPNGIEYQQSQAGANNFNGLYVYVFILVIYCFYTDITQLTNIYTENDNRANGIKVAVSGTIFG